MSRAVVLGANGFLGALLIDHLVAAGHEVTAFDRFSGEHPNFSASDVRILRGDFQNRSDLAEAVRGQDLVFHFLWTTTPGTVIDEPHLDIRTNVAQTLELLDLAAAEGVTCFYFASSGGAVYGDQTVELNHEELGPRPVSPYGIGKVTIEHFLRYYATRRDLRSVVFRLANPYGPSQKPKNLQGLVATALQHARSGEPMPLLGDGSMSRDYIFAPDAVEMIGRVIAGMPRHGIYNIGTGRASTVAEVLEIVRQVTSAPLSVDRLEMPSTYMQRSVLDVTRFVAEFGHPPTTSLEDGIRASWVAAESHPSASE